MSIYRREHNLESIFKQFNSLVLYVQIFRINVYVQLVLLLFKIQKCQGNERSFLKQFHKNRSVLYYQTHYYTQYIYTKHFT